MSIDRDDKINWSKVNIKKMIELCDSVFTKEEWKQVAYNIHNKKEYDYKMLSHYCLKNDVESSWKIFWRK